MKKNSFFFIFFALFLLFCPISYINAQNLTGRDACVSLKTILSRNGYYPFEQPIIYSEAEDYPFNIRLDFEKTTSKEKNQKENTIIKNSTLVIVVPIYDALQNLTVTLKVLNAIKTSIRQERIQVLFVYDNIKKNNDIKIKSGTETFIEQLDEPEKYYVICFFLTNQLNKIIPGSGKDITPAWFLNFVTDCFFKNRIFYIIQGGIISSFYRLNLLKENEILSYFLQNKITALSIELGGLFNDNKDYENKIINFVENLVYEFSSELIKKWDRHYLPVQVGLKTYILPERVTITIALLTAFISLFLLCEFSFITHKKKKDLLKQVSHSWYLVPAAALFTCVFFIIGQYFALLVSSILNLNIYTQIIIKIVFGFFFICLIFLFRLKKQGAYSYEIYSFLLTLTSIFNIFLFSALDLSLFYLFCLEYLIIYFSRFINFTIGLIVVFFALAIPFIPYLVQIILYANPKTFDKIIYCNFLQNLALTFAFLPFELIFLRIFTRLNKIWAAVDYKKRTFIKQNIIAIILSVGIFTLILMLATLFIPEQYKQKIIAQEYDVIEDTEEKIISLTYDDDFYFGDTIRNIHLCFFEQPEAVELTIDGTTANPIIYSEDTYVSNSSLFSDSFLIPLYPPKKMSFSFVTDNKQKSEISLTAYMPEDLFLDKKSYIVKTSVTIQEKANELQ